MSAFRVNLRDGSTLSFDLETPEGRESWRDLRLLQCDQITGLSLISCGVHYAIPIPQKFNSVIYDAEVVQHRDGSGRVVGDVIRLFVDDVCVQLLVYRGSSKMARLSVDKTGRPIFIPSLESKK